MENINEIYNRIMNIEKVNGFTIKSEDSTWEIKGGFYFDEGEKKVFVQDLARAFIGYAGKVAIIENIFNGVLFLDIDGVLNHELFYLKRFNNLDRHSNIPLFRTVKQYLKKMVKKKEISSEEYYESNIDSESVKIINRICETNNLCVVISSTWRLNKTIEELQKILNKSGATFKVVDKTGKSEERVRGVEIKKWLDENCKKYFDVHSFDFKDYVILDDNNDFLIEQQPNFFQCDPWCGVTITIEDKIRRFFGGRMFPNSVTN